MTAIDLRLSRHSFHGLLNGAQRLLQWVLACLAIVFFSGCTDGYPTEDEMTQAQRLQAMNPLGQEAHQGFTWRYRAMPGCSLQWTVQGGDAGKESAQALLWGAAIDLRLDKIDQVYGIQVRPAGPSNLKELTLMLSKNWVQTIEMSHLVRWFQIGCGAANAAAAPGNPNPL